MKTEFEKYSIAQREAIQTFGQELFVSAGAGSGKTSVLVERFLYAVTRQKMDPERILAITFTEKAAGEMKSRLVEECRKRDLKDFRRKLESAYISTIHSFCLRILKENPIEGGIDPYFQVLGNGEAEILTRNVLGKIFEGQSGNPGLLELLNQFGEEPVRRIVKKFYEMERALGADGRIFRSHDHSKVQTKIAADLTREAKVLDELIDPAKATEQELKLKNGAAMVLKIAGPPSIFTWDIVTQAEEARKSLHRKSPKYKEMVDSLHGLLDDWIALAAAKLGEPMKKEFESLCLSFKTLYDEEKRARAVCDFEDLLFLTYQLLSGSSPEKKAVLKRYQDLFSCLLVDEYQDTSPLQDKIIEMLKQKNNLFIVGDAQQSIYGFRFADPDIFHGRISEGGEGGKARHIRLDDNYRSKKEILSFINNFFEKTVEAGSFYNLQARRVFDKSAVPAVEILCVPRGEGDESDEIDFARVLEARSLAAHIKKTVESKTLVREKNDQARPIAYRDIAILFRGMKRSYLFEKELSDLQIPYVVTKGGGFYEKPEILDFLNNLKLIENPYLDIPLAGVLRSPLVDISDDALFWLATSAKRSDRDRPLARALEDLGGVPEISSEDVKKIAAFSTFLEELRREKDTLKISQILEKILKNSSYEAKVLTRPDGKQKIANILKLIMIAETVEEKNIAGIQDFVRYIESLSDSEISETEASIASEHSNAVTLSTIHAAKGLEFPMVIIADMGRKDSRGRKEPFLSSPEAGLGLKLRNPKKHELIKDYTFRKIEERLDLKESLEENRLLYVALTRAQERLVLSGSLEVDQKTGDFKKGASWMSRLAEAVRLSPSVGSKSLIFGDISIDLLPIQKEPHKEKIDTWSWADDLTRARPFVINNASEAGLKKRLKPVDKEYEETEDHTVTDLLLVSQDRAVGPALFIAEPDKDLGAEIGETVTPRNEYGTLYHRLMEYCVSRRKKKISGSFLPSPMFKRLQPPEVKEMKNSILKFWSGPWGKEIRDARQCFAELPFIYKTKQGILKGQVDLLFQSKKGEWVVLDYKTNRLKPSEKEAVAREYEAQILIYAFVFRKLYGETPRRGVLYFSSIDESFDFNYTDEKLESFEADLNGVFKKAIKSL